MTDLSDALPDEFEGRSALLTSKGFETVADLAKGYVEAEKYQNSIQETHLKVELGEGQKPTPERLAKLRKAVGAPDTSDAYSLPDGVPDGLRDVLAKLQPTAYEAMLSTEGFQKLSGSLVSNLEALSAAQDASRTEARQRATEALKGEWGEGYAEKAALAERMTNRLAEQHPDFIQGMKDAGMADDPHFTRFLGNLADVAGDDRAPDQLSPPSTETSEEISLSEAKKKALRGSEICASPEWTSRAAEHEFTKEKLRVEFAGIITELDAAGFTGLDDPKLQGV